jgi:hypothetical protein
MVTENKEIIPEKGTIDYVKWKRKQYNKTYLNKLKSEKTNSEKSTNEQDETESFFFPQQNQKPQQKTEKNTEKNTEKKTKTQKQIVVQMPTVPIQTQIKNQLLMSLVGFIPMLLVGVYKAYENQQTKLLQNPYSNQSKAYATNPQCLNF